MAWSSSDSSCPGTRTGLTRGSDSFPRSAATARIASQSTLSRMLSRNSGLKSILSSCCRLHLAPSYVSGKLSLLGSQAFTEHLI